MGFLTSCRQLVDDLLLVPKRHKLRAILCVCIVVIGFVLGIVVASTSQGWWHQNRVDYAKMLVTGNFFAIFVSLLVQLVVIVFALGSSCCIKYAMPLRYLSAFAMALYCGANLSCVFALVGLLGILYLLLFFLWEIVVCLLFCWMECFPTDYLKTIREIWADCKGQVCAVCLITIAKILLLFVLLRPLSVSI